MHSHSLGRSVPKGKLSVVWMASHTMFSLEADFTKKQTVHKAADKELFSFYLSIRNFILVISFFSTLQKINLLF
jgi:hypothetical protein